MTRNEEKARSMLNRFITMKEEENRSPKQLRPYLASECRDLEEADGNAQVLMGDTSRRFPAGGRRSESNPRLPHRDTPEGSNAQQAAAGAGDLSPQDLDLIMARFDRLELRLNSTERRFDKRETPRALDPDPPDFLDEANVEGYRSQGDVWDAYEDVPRFFNHGRRDRGGDVPRCRGAARDTHRREGSFAHQGVATDPYSYRPGHRPRSSWDRPEERYQHELDRGQDRAWSYPPDRPRIPRSYFSRNSYVQRRCSTTNHYSWLDQQPSTGWPPPPPRRYPPRHVYSTALPVPSSMRKDEVFLSRSISYGRDESEDLYWEMMSSFSHNSSLRRVDRCSKTGSAPEMKAIREACSLRSRSGTDSLVSENEFSHTHSSRYASFTNEMREQEEEMSDLPRLEAQMEHSFDNAKDFNYSSKNERVEEHSDNPGSSFFMASRLEIEVDAVGDHGASNLDVAGVTNQSIALRCDKRGVEEDQDASPESPRVSSLDDITPTPLPAVAFLRICNPVVQEYIRKNLVYVAEVCGTLGAAYSFFRPKKITSGRAKEVCKWRRSPFDDHIRPLLLIFGGGEDGRSSVVRYVFDPGGDATPSFFFQLLSLARGSHLEDKVDFNRGGVDTSLHLVRYIRDLNIFPYIIFLFGKLGF